MHVADWRILAGALLCCIGPGTSRCVWHHRGLESDFDHQIGGRQWAWKIGVFKSAAKLTAPNQPLLGLFQCCFSEPPPHFLSTAKFAPC